MHLRSMIVPFAAMAALGLPAQAATNWDAVAKALGKSGSAQADGVYRVGLPRSDLKVTLDGVAIKPGLALGSWVAFHEMADGQAMVMGDLVLTHSEINPVIDVLEANGIEITALHNHLLRSTPATMYMHIDGHGDPVTLARAIHAALAKTHTPLGAAPAAKAAPLDLDTAMLDRTLGAKGQANGGVYAFSIPRAQAPRSDGVALPPPMGAAIGINFQPTGGGKAATTGDFVLTAEEVNPVIRALRAAGIEVTALHNHMLDDEPRLFFMHFWANEDAAREAKGLRAALDRVKIARP
jgi:biotin operon repressor